MCQNCVSRWGKSNLASFKKNSYDNTHIKDFKRFWYFRVFTLSKDYRLLQYLFNELTTRYSKQIFIHRNINFPSTNFRKRIDTWKPQPLWI